MGRTENCLSAAKIGGIYVLLGVIWIVFSDRIVLAMAPSEESLTLIQTAKGWVFVGASAILIFVLVRRSQREIVAKNERLRDVLHQASILHRILRHNLRNSCTVIGGNIELLAERVENEAEIIDTIRQRNERLIALSEKSRFFRGFLDVREDDVDAIDLVAAVETHVSMATERFPRASIHVDTPDRAYVYGHYFLSVAIEELIENAIEHNQSAQPTVWLTVDQSGDSTELSVRDDGPGIPRTERETLQRGSETQVQHSRGIGLWLVKMTILESGGSFDIGDRHPYGATVTISLPSAPTPEPAAE